MLLLLASLAHADAPASERPRCLTPELLARRNAALAGVAPPAPTPNRPDAVGFVDSDVYPLRVHWRREEDAERAATVVLPIAEHCWQVQVDQMGWPSPPADSGVGGDNRFDLYLTNDETYGGAWTWGTGNDTNPDDGWYSLASFIALDDRAISDEAMADFVCHEFNHALQYTIDGWELTLFPWEMTAEAMEELTVPDSDIYQLDIPDFQELPFMSLLFDGYSDEVMEYDDYSYYEYGGSIVGLYLEQRFGTYDGTTLLALWDAMAQPGIDNEPDFVDGLDVIGGDIEVDHGALYLDLAAWRMFAGPLDDGAHFDEGSEWPRTTIVAQEATLRTAELDGYTLDPVDPPYDLGASYWGIDLTEASDKVLRIEITGDSGPEWGIVGATWLSDGPARVVDARGGTEGAPVSLDLDLAGGTRAMIAVASLGPQDLDAEGRHGRRSFTGTLTLVDAADTGDTGDSGGDNGGDNGGDTDSGEPAGGDDTGGTTEKGGCGCTSTSPAGLPALALLGLALTVRRRR